MLLFLSSNAVYMLVYFCLSGAVVTAESVEKIIKKDMIDPINGKKMVESDLIPIQRVNILDIGIFICVIFLENCVNKYFLPLNHRSYLQKKLSHFHMILFLKICYKKL